MKSRHIHLVGIKGVAMAALAVYLNERGDLVTGSDVPETFPTDSELAHLGIRIYEGFDSSHIVGKNRPDIVYFTGAHEGRGNIEVQTALEHDIPVYPHGQALGMLAQSHRQIVVTGCHGKTTTSAMIATLLSKGGSNPSYAIGCGNIVGIGAAGHFGTGPWMVIEGDEYITDPNHDKTPRFMWLMPEILVVTNVDYDHPDAYADLSAVKEAYGMLSTKMPQNSVRIINADDVNSRELLKEKNVITFGRSPVADFCISSITQGPERMFFRIRNNTVDLGEFSLSVPGVHNVMNATAALIAAHESGISWDKAREHLSAFQGTARRFERLGESRGVTFIDDYAHHPEEIKSTLKAARSWFGKRNIIAVFQPHTYSRTKSLLSRFASAFSDADRVILTDIYASAREHDTLGITAETLVSETLKQHPSVSFCKASENVREHLFASLHEGDVVLFMGAGDIYNWSRNIFKDFSA